MTWPACLGPNGCMRTRSIPTVRIAHVCLEMDEDDGVDPSKILEGGIPPNKIARVYGPVLRKFGNNPPVEKVSKGRQGNRKSVSLSLHTYTKLKEAAALNHRSMASIVDTECNRFIDEKDEE